MNLRLRAHRRHRQPSLARDLPLAGVAALLMAGLLALALTAPYGIPFRSYYDLTADFRNAASITVFSEVRMSGKLVGQVTDITSSNGIAHVDLQLDPSVEPLRSDTTAHIRLKGLLGAKFVDLTRGDHGTPLAGGATIPVTHTSTTVELADVLNALDPRRRADLGSTLRGLGVGFLGRGAQLNAALGDAPPMLRGLDSVASAVNARAGAAERFFPSLESAAAAYDPVRAALAAGFDPQARALRPFVDRSQAVQSALQVAPGALEAMRAGLARNDPLLRETAGLARATIQLTRFMPAAMTSTAALLHDSPAPLRGLRTLLNRAAAAVSPTLRFTGAIDPLIPPSIRALSHSTPGLAEIARRGCDVGAVATSLRSVLGFGKPDSGELGGADLLRFAFDLPSPEPNAYKRDRYPPPCVTSTETLR
jgi:virulence factor Mce-like protein